MDRKSDLKLSPKERAFILAQRRAAAAVEAGEPIARVEELASAAAERLNTRTEPLWEGHKGIATGLYWVAYPAGFRHAWPTRRTSAPRATAKVA